MVSKEAFSHYLLGIPDLDNEHWELIQNMNLCIQRWKNHEFDDAREMVTKLIGMLNEHFVHEEKFMEEVKFPYIDAHKRAHQNTAFEMKRLYDSIKIDEPSHYHMRSLERFVDVLYRVFVTHIDHYDIQFIDFMKDKK